MKQFLPYLFLFLHLGLFSQSQEVLLYENSDFIENPHISFYIDKSSTETIESISDFDDEKFTKHNGILNLGLLNKPVWIKLKIKNNNSSSTKWVLNVNFSLIDTLKLYQKIDNGTFKESILGEMFPTTTRYYDSKNFCFPVHLPYDQYTELYIRAKTEGTMYLPIIICNEETVQLQEKNNFTFYGIFCGAALLIVAYNLIFYFTLHDKLYLLYCAYIIILVTILSYFNGYISYFNIFNENREMLNNLFANSIFSFVFISTLFAYKFLDVGKFSKGISFYMKTVMVLCLCLTVLSFFIKYKTIITIGTVLYIIIPASILCISTYIWLKGNRIARFYVIASALFMVSVSMLSLRAAGVISGNKIQLILIELGAILDAVMVSVALADKLKQLRADFEVSQKMELKHVADKERLVAEQNTILEQKINRRTKEIVEKNEQLEQLTDTIKQQNQLLSEYNENLEKQIDIATKEVLKSNQKLERKTSRLEQVAFIVSHNLKSPINNMQSLLNFINYDKLEPESREYFSLISKSNVQLKKIIDDINLLVKMENDQEIEFVKIDLEQEIKDIKDKLMLQLGENDTTLETDLRIKYIDSFKPYLSSILYNFISNAIKYSNPQKSPKINVSSYQTDSNIYISVKDNGNGIDSKHLDNIFKLFYRIEKDKDKEGKGMGLYIVKSQAEQLGGKIEVSSTLGEGSTFSLVLPIEKK
jgi:two-component system, sensor histidine kinase LadS